MRPKRIKRGQRTAKLGLLHRTMTVVRDDGDPDDPDRGRELELSISSEEPYERYFGVEILGHKRTEVILDRLADGAPLLKDHDTRQQIGVIESAKVDTKDRKVRVRARFGRTALAEEERIEVADGIRSKVSVGYIVHAMKLESSADGVDSFRVTSWEPLEASFVAIPADGTVGPGRDADLPGLAERAATWANHKTRILGLEGSQRGNKMIRVLRLSDGVIVSIREDEFDAELYAKVNAEPAAPAPAAPVQVGRSDEDVARITDEAVQKAQKAERERVSTLQALGSKFNSSDSATKAIANGETVEQFRWTLFEAGATPGGTPAAGMRDYPSLQDNPHDAGISQKEATESYSLLRAIRSFSEQDPTLAPYEREVSASIAKKAGVKTPRGLYVPRELLGAPISAYPGDSGVQALMDQLRAVSTTVGGGAAVATNLLAGSFIDILRNESVVLQLGATLLPGLVGDVDIPRQSATAAAGWITEGSSAADADLTLDTVSLVPKTLAAKMKLTRKLMLQSTPAIEALVRADLASGIATGLDVAAINGSGAGAVPEGILQMTGLGAGLSLGANGGSQTWANQVELVKLVKKANAHTGSLGWATSVNGWAHLMTTVKVAGQPNFIVNEPGETSIGRRLIASENVPSTLVKAASGAVLSALIYGAWNELLIGEWGAMDLFPDIYSAGDEGATIVRVFQDADVAARHEDAFAASVEIAT